MFKLFLYDINIQLRSGYWTVYGVIGLIYILVLVNIPPSVRDDIAIYLIFSDTSVLGLIFVGALVLFEKQQGVLRCLSVTPLKLDSYLFSKVFSLTLLSTTVSLLIWIIPNWSLKGFAPLLSGIILASMIFTLFGLGFAAGAESFNHFLARIILGSLILVIPVIPMLFFPDSRWLTLLPMNSVLDLFLEITRGYSFSLYQITDLVILTIWIFIMREFAKYQFRKNSLFI